jgi:hypothetical protein
MCGTREPPPPTFLILSAVQIMEFNFNEKLVLDILLLSWAIDRALKRKAGGYSSLISHHKKLICNWRVSSSGI